LSLLAQLKPEQLNDPSIATYRAILLLEAGRRDEARQVLPLADKAMLLPEERTMLAEAKARL
jgi:hypothetical protein